MAAVAALLPNGEQQFFDNDGVPLAAGQVFFYVPSTTTFKNTYQDPGQSVLNTNPVILDGSGRAIIYGIGQYRQVVEDSLGNVIWDQLTQGASTFITGSVTIAGATTTDIGASGSNFVIISGSASIASFGSSATVTNPLYFILFTGASALINSSALVIPGGQNLTTQNGAFAIAYYQGSGNWTILEYVKPNGQILSFAGQDTTLASGTTTDLGTLPGNFGSVTGNATITSFGSSASTANPLYFIKFTGNAILTYNATSLILPGTANITTSPNSSALAEYLGSGNWAVLMYTNSAAGGGGSASGIIGDTRNNVWRFASNTTLTATVDEVIAKTAIGGTTFLGTSLSTTLNFGSVGANGIDAGAIAASTAYGLYWIFNPTSSTWATLASLSFTAPTLPSGYTAFGLVGAVVTNASSQIVAGFNLYDRTSTFQPISILTNASGATSLTSQSIAAAVPTIAKFCSGVIGTSSTSISLLSVVASDSGGTGKQAGGNETAANTFMGLSNPLSFEGLQVITSQTIFWAVSLAGASAKVNLQITGFTI